MDDDASNEIEKLNEPVWTRHTHYKSLVTPHADNFTETIVTGKIKLNRTSSMHVGNKLCYTQLSAGELKYDLWGKSLWDATSSYACFLPVACNS